MSFRFDHVLRVTASLAVVFTILAMSPVSVDAANISQDFSATFPQEGTPGLVTVVVTNLNTGQTIVPYASFPVPGLGPYIGRHQFAARTGGADADQDVQEIFSDYVVGGASSNVPYPITPFESGYVTGGNGAYAPNLVPPGAEDWLRLAANGTGGIQAAAAWDTVWNTPYDTVSHTFNFSISGTGNPANDQADGVGWAFLDVDNHGDTGIVGPGTSEEPNYTGSLGIGFDIWDNGGEGGNSVSLHFGSTLESLSIDEGTTNPNTMDDWGFNSFETGDPHTVVVQVTPGDDTPDPILKGGTQFAVNNYGGNPSKIIQQEGMDGFLRIAEEAGGQGNIVAFDYTMDGTDINASFNFRALTTEDSNRADGMSFLLVPTDIYGETGAEQIAPFGPDNAGAPGGVEEANLEGAFGVGFDTFNNDAGEQDEAEGMADVGNHISTHFNGEKLLQTNYSLGEFDLATTNPDVWHKADIVIQPGNGGSNVTVVVTDGEDGEMFIPFSDFIPGMSLDSVRPVFAARTGGAFDNYDIDNVLIEYPGTGPICDFDGNSECDINDINMLMNDGETGGTGTDLNGDNVVDNTDRDLWLAAAGPANGFVGSLLVGDADLNGTVEALDLNPLAISWQDATQFDWSDGNFVIGPQPGVNVADLNGLGGEWQNQVAIAAANEAVPEPTGLALVLAGLFGLFVLRRRD